MIFKEGECSKEIPERIEESTAELYLYTAGDPETNGSSYALLVCRIPIGDLLRMRQKQKIGCRDGQPTLFAVNIQPGRNQKLADFIELFPIPDKEYYARFRYCPAAREI